MKLFERIFTTGMSLKEQNDTINKLYSQREIAQNNLGYDLRLIENSIDTDFHRGYRLCDECASGIDDEQTFYFSANDPISRFFCHPSCVKLYYLSK